MSALNQELPIQLHFGGPRISGIRKILGATKIKHTSKESVTEKLQN